MRIHANLTFFFLSGFNPETNCNNLCFVSLIAFSASDSLYVNDTKNVVSKLKNIPQPALWIVKGYAPHGTPNQAEVLSVNVTAISPTISPETTPLVVKPL